MFRVFGPDWVFWGLGFSFGFSVLGFRFRLIGFRVGSGGYVG